MEGLGTDWVGFTRREGLGAGGVGTFGLGAFFRRRREVVKKRVWRGGGVHLQDESWVWRRVKKCH